VTKSPDGQVPDDRTALAKAIEWATVVMTVSAEMVVPGLVGVWLDGRLGTVVAMTLVGFAGGSVLAIWHLMRLLTRATERSAPDASRKRPKP
jgi:hypothetical protein